jgi:sensor histidine kinase regulating citrate/malate metabolism
VLGEGDLIVVFGVLAGLIGSVMLTRFLQTMLFDIKPTDPITCQPVPEHEAILTFWPCLIRARRNWLDPV